MLAYVDGMLMIHRLPVCAASHSVRWSEMMPLHAQKSDVMLGMRFMLSAKPLALVDGLAKLCCASWTPCLSPYGAAPSCLNKLGRVYS